LFAELAELAAGSGADNLTNSANPAYSASVSE
jgi:hypothetical protein